MLGVMNSFPKTGTLNEFQQLISDIYALPDDKIYSIWDLLTQQERFAMRALKGVRKGDRNKIKINLLISFSWLMAIANRLHINIEDNIWRRFPMLCSYCAKRPCICKATRPTVRSNVKIDNTLKPVSLALFQKMFDEIYPTKNRTITDAGIHLAEEVGEVSEIIHNYLGQHLEKQFNEIKIEVADLVSCIFGVANSADIDVATELSLMFDNNCHVCHKAPCICSFSEVVHIQS